MGSAAQDHQGNLAVGYSSGDETKKPSIFYTGRLASEPAGTFRNEENFVIGTGVQKAFGFRWGDYSAMSVDPSDDCTFWYTNEYFSQASEDESDFGWLTRIGKFKFAECTGAPRATINGLVSTASGGIPIPNATVTANAVYVRTTDASGSYGNLILVPNTYTITASARGFRSKTVTVTVTNGQTLIQHFALEATAIFENAALNITSESCAPNSAIDPSETVTVEIGLMNTGARNTTNLVATLLAAGGVLNPSAAQNYGAIPVGGAAVSRPFTFTASPDLNCGGVITLTFYLQDGTEDLGAVTISVNTGRQRTAFSENFDSVDRARSARRLDDERDRRANRLENCDESFSNCAEFSFLARAEPNRRQRIRFTRFFDNFAERGIAVQKLV